MLRVIVSNRSINFEYKSTECFVQCGHGLEATITDKDISKS